jgi:hypothetical protein
MNKLPVAVEVVTSVNVASVIGIVTVATNGVVDEVDATRGDPRANHPRHVRPRGGGAGHPPPELAPAPHAVDPLLATPPEGALEVFHHQGAPKDRIRTEVAHLPRRCPPFSL